MAPTSCCSGLFTAVATACRSLGTALGLGLGPGGFMGSSISSSFLPLPAPPRAPNPPQFWGGKERYQRVSFRDGYSQIGSCGKVTGLISEREGTEPPGAGGGGQGEGCRGGRMGNLAVLTSALGLLNPELPQPSLPLTSSKRPRPICMCLVEIPAGGASPSLSLPRPPGRGWPEHHRGAQR